MGNIATWLNEVQQNMMAQQTVDMTEDNVLSRNDLLNEFVPIRFLENFNELAYLVKQSSPIAQLVGRGQEAPLVGMGELRKMSYQLIKIGLAINYDEQTQIDMRQAVTLAANMGVEVYGQALADGTIVRGADQGLAKLLFGNYETITKALYDITKFLTCTCLQYGGTSGYKSPLTGVSQDIDYRDVDAEYGFAPYGRLAHFPPSLAGTAKAWNQSETATAFEDLREWTDIYTQSNGGKAPDAVMWNKATTRDVLKQRSTLRQFTTINNGGVTVSGVETASKDMLRRKMEEMELPLLIENDEQFTEVNYAMEGGKQVRKERRIYFHNTRRVTFLQRNMGEMLIGPTVEGDFTPGFNITTYEKQKRPILDQTEGWGNILPVFVDSRKLYSREVRDIAA
jgi:hypothetical protein